MEIRWRQSRSISWPPTMYGRQPVSRWPTVDLVHNDDQSKPARRDGLDRDRVMLGKMLALDGGPDGVRSNVLCPGDIWPGMRHMAPPGDQDGSEGAGHWPVPPIGRVGQASDVAAAAVFYASNQAGFITGTTLLVDGGMTAGYLQRERDAQRPPAPGSDA
jgi:hypothetical protein